MLLGLTKQKRVGDTVSVYYLIRLRVVEWVNLERRNDFLYHGVHSYGAFRFVSRCDFFINHVLETPYLGNILKGIFGISPSGLSG